MDIFRRPLPNRHQYHQSRRLHPATATMSDGCPKPLPTLTIRQLRTLRTGPQLDNRRRRKSLTNYYFHCDPIGIPREMTDKDGNLLWFGNYTGWGRLKEETKVLLAHTNPSASKTSIATVKRVCITIFSGIMSLMRVSL